MKRIFTFILILTLTGCIVSSKICGSGLFVCNDNSTCCREKNSFSGFRCFEITDGNCCDDIPEMTVCPEFAVCNAEKKHCSVKENSEFLQSLKFLSENNKRSLQNLAYVPFELSYEPKFTQDGDQGDYKDLISGFVEGVEIFNNVKFCKDDPQIIEDLKQIIEVIKSIRSLADVPAAVEKISTLFKDYLERLQKLEEECAETESEIQDLLNKLSTYFNDSGFSTKFITHSITHALKIKDDIEDIKKNFSTAPYHDSGKKIGGLVHFVLLWDFKACGCNSH